MVVSQQGLSGNWNGFTVGAWKAVKYPGNTSQTRFPTIGQQAPASPDATAVVATGAYSLSTPTDEPYHVAIYDAQNKIVYHFLNAYQPPTYQARSDYTGPGAPPAAFKPPDGSTWTSSTSAAAGSRMWICWGGVWTASAA